MSLSQLPPPYQSLSLFPEFFHVLREGSDSSEVVEPFPTASQLPASFSLSEKIFSNGGRGAGVFPFGRKGLQPQRTGRAFSHYLPLP